MSGGRLQGPLPTDLSPEAVRWVTHPLARLAEAAGVPTADLIDAIRRERLESVVPDDRIVALDLPEPPAIQGRENWYEQMKRIKETKRKTWAAACSCVRPFERPPRRVRLHAHYRLWNRRDPWNLPHNLKPVIDALQVDLGSTDERAWRQGLWPDRGYFVEDADAEVGVMTQEIDRGDRGLRLIIEVLDPDWEDPR